MTLREYLAIAGRWWWLAVLGCVLAGGAAYLVTSATTRIYRSEALLLVNQAQNPSSVTYQDILGSQQLTKTYAQLVTSNLNLGDAAKKLNDPTLTLPLLQGKVSASAETGTQLVRVAAEDPSPQRAALIANAVAETFVNYVEKAQLAGQTSSTSNLNTVFVAETAEATRSPVRPNRTLNVALGVFLGLIVVVSAIALVEYLDDDMDSREEVERLSLPFLGSVFQADPPKGVKREGWIPSVIREDPTSPFAESFRQIQASLAYSLSTDNLKTLVVTSAGAGEGKSTTAANLAETLAESSRRILLIDGDLRKPDVHRYFDLPNHSGITSAFLAEPDALESFIKRVNERLFVFTSGPVPPNPAELLNSKKMSIMVDKLAEQFDLIVVDSPPLLGLADASVWASLTDGILLVARKGKTRRGPFEEAVAAAQASKKPILGVIVNGTQRGKASPYYYYGYGHGKEGSVPRP